MYSMHFPCAEQGQKGYPLKQAHETSTYPLKYTNTVAYKRKNTVVEKVLQYCSFEEPLPCYDRLIEEQ